MRVSGAAGIRGTRYGWSRDLVLALPAGCIVAGWLLLAALHLSDRYQVGHGQGVWMALARHANTDGLYPPLVGAGAYGGSRYMPLPILLHAGVARITGEYLISGKLVGLATTIGLLVVVFAALRRLGCRWSWAFALSASIVGGFSGLRAGTTIGGEPLPVIFGVAALAVVMGGRSHVRLGAAAGLVALGVAAKLTALWAPAAIAAWLLVEDRRRAVTFVFYTAAATVLLLGAFQLASDGRMLENLSVMWGAGLGGATGVLKAPVRLLGYLAEGELTTWALLPVLFYATASLRWTSVTALLLLSWLAAACLLIVIYADVGTGPNQLIDLSVLTVLATGALVGAAAGRDDVASRLTAGLVAAILIWSLSSTLVVRMRQPIQDAVSAAKDGRKPYPRDLLTAQLSPGQSLLSEDPGVLVELGLTPVVFDPFMFRRLAETRPDAVASLVAMVERKEFDLIVLVVKLERTDDVWWQKYHFGPRLMRAVDRAYQLDRRVGTHHLYRPRP
jgi:hypothetical protein